ncbi:MAG: ferritin [Phycisphaerae bacterium]|nr:ferritin [Phycisphaerae bacterium]
MLSEKIQKALNEQLNAELYSAYLYLSMRAWFESKNLKGFANWMNIQTQEETMHALKFFSFITERGGRVKLEQIKGPETEWKSPLAIFEAGYKHEQYVTSRINDLVNIAIEEKDHATNSFLQWFVNEQVEEEANSDGVVQQLKLVESTPGGMFMLDKELGRRVFTPPVQTKE